MNTRSQLKHNISLSHSFRIPLNIFSYLKSSIVIYYSLIGFVPVLYTDCNAWWSVSFISLDYWTAFANIIAVLVLFHLLIMQYSFTKYGIHRDYKACESTGSSIHEEVRSYSSCFIHSFRSNVFYAL